MVAVQRNLSKFGIREIARTGKVKNKKNCLVFSVLLLFMLVDVGCLN